MAICNWDVAFLFEVLIANEQINKQTNRQTKQAKKPILCRSVPDFKGLTVILFIDVYMGVSVVQKIVEK